LQPRCADIQLLLLLLLLLLLYRRARNVVKKEAEKSSKYANLTTEVQHMSNIRIKVIPELTGASGTVSESLRQYLRNIPGKHEIKKLQKTVILGTAYILREVPM